jgi:hypothetical protein
MYRQGKSFNWLSEDDPEQIDRILSVIFETPEEIKPSLLQVNESVDALKQADAWLSNLETMEFNQKETEQAAKVAKAKKLKQAQTAARKPRRAASLTPEVVADYFKSRPGEKWEAIQAELADAYSVSFSTVARRYRTAEGNNLLS